MADKKWMIKNDQWQKESTVHLPDQSYKTAVEERDVLECLNDSIKGWGKPYVKIYRKNWVRIYFTTSQTEVDNIYEKKISVITSSQTLDFDVFGAA